VVRAAHFGDGSDPESTAGASARGDSTPNRSANSGTTGESKGNGTVNDSTVNTELDQGSGISDDAPTGGTDEQSSDVADNRHALIKVLNDNPPKALLISILITGCIGAPLLEELLVRGFLFGAFSQRFGKLAGGAISSLLFGFAHIMAYPLKMILPLVILGAALAWLAWQTGSIVPGMFIHAFVNSLGLGVGASLGGHILTLMVGS
jgi:VIT1/CCC1 family predicted Fe2+/Mn2+ transporter